jgi:hypothetical protein
MPAKLLLFPFLLGLFIGGSSFAQEASLSKREKKELQRKRVAEVVEAKQYKIQVQQAFTMRGRQINLTGAYGMIVTPERIQCDLPYFGQSYGGTSYGGEGGVKLDSKDFTYESISTKKGGWDVTITPKDDTKDVRTVVLNISSDGYISLNFTFNTRSIMRYSGVIVTEEKK